MNRKKLQALSLSQVNDLTKAERQALKLLRKLGDTVRTEAVKKVLVNQSIKDVVANAYAKPLTQALVFGHLLGQRRAYLNARTRPKVIALGLYEETIKSYDRIDPAYLEFITYKYSSRAFTILEGASEAADLMLRDVLANGFKQQDTVGGLKQLLGDAFTRLGLTPGNSYQIENIVRTQTQLAFQAGKWRAENFDPDIAAMLWGYTYYTVGDDRVRETHIGLDGTVLPKDSAFWRTHYPPNGWSCRCQAVPLYEEEKVVLPKTSEPNDPDFNFNAGEVFSGISTANTATVPDSIRNLLL